MKGVIVLVLVVSGCGTTSLTLTPSTALDRTVPQRIEKQFASIMVLPRSGSEHGQASDLTTAIERVLLAGGIRVISSGVTGRIVMDNAGNRVETGATLSDLERALVLAKSSNAEALLQVVELGFTEGQRWFVRASGDRLEEIGPGHNIDPANSVKVREATFHFQARLISVENGEIMMNVDVWQATSRTGPQARTFSFQTSPTGLVGPNEIDTDTQEHRREAIDDVMNVLLTRITTRRPAVAR